MASGEDVVAVDGTEVSAPLKIFFSCSGVGILNRGIESFFREAFDGLRGTDGLDITLYKGAGEKLYITKNLHNTA